MIFKTIYTTYGLNRMAAAAVTGIPINLTLMSVGDGGGAPVTPDASQTSLVHENYRTTINALELDAANPSEFYAEMVIPYSVGGWTIREFGIWDDNNELFAVGNYPETYKTVPSDGASSDQVIRAQLIIDNASLVNIVVDPSVAVATRSWALNTITIAMLLPGGTIHQVLRKKTNANGDTEWADQTDVHVTVDTIQELQNGVNTQATFNLTTVTTLGLAVYKAGVRVPYRAGAGGWQLGTPSTTQVVLGTALTGATEMLFVQNEPAGTAGTPLQASNNLSDVASAATARTNLGVYSKSETDQKSPAGMVAYFAMPTAPTGWLKCNGAVISRSVYDGLFAAIGTIYGAGDGSTTFALPDLRGDFLRSFDDGRGIDSGRSFASSQGYATAQPRNTSPVRVTQTGTASLVNATNPSTVGFVRVTKTGENATTSGFDSANSGTELDVLNVVTGDFETRPINVAQLCCIKY